MERHARTRADLWRCDGMKDLQTAIVLLAVAVAGFVFINPNGSSVYPGDGGLTWRTLPFGYAGFLGLLACVYIAQSIRKIRIEMGQDRPTPPTPEQAAEDRVVFIRRAISIALLLAFASLLKVFGFALMVPIFLFCLFRLYQRGPWTGDLGLSVGGGLALWVLFVPVLKMNLKGDIFDPLTPFLLTITKMAGL